MIHVAGERTRIDITTKCSESTLRAGQSSSALVSSHELTRPIKESQSSHQIFDCDILLDANRMTTAMVDNTNNEAPAATIRWLPLILSSTLRNMLWCTTSTKQTILVEIQLTWECNGESPYILECRTSRIELCTKSALQDGKQELQWNFLWCLSERLILVIVKILVPVAACLKMPLHVSWFSKHVPFPIGPKLA